MTTAVEQVVRYCKHYDVLCAGANERGECNTTACWNSRRLERSIDTVPTIVQMSPAEPKTGKWIIATGMMPPEFHGHHCCSECGNFANMEPPFGNREDLSKFCPHCGAKMVREEGERCL